MKNCYGYIAVVEEKIIEGYSNISGRGRIMSKHHGKALRYIDGRGAFNQVEQWLINRIKCDYRVNKYGDIHAYYSDESVAKEVAEKLGKKLEKVTCNNHSKGTKSTKSTTVVKKETFKETTKETVRETTEITETVIEEIKGKEVYEAQKIVKEIDSKDMYDYVLNSIETLSEFTGRIDIMIDELSFRMSEVDKRIVDIEHEIEFNKYDASGGYKAYRKLHEAFNERRVIKDNVHILGILKRSNLGGGLTHIERKLDQLDSRIYTPRSKERKCV